MDFSEIIATLSDYSILVPVLVILIYRDQNPSNKLLIAVVFVTFVRNLASVVIEYVRYDLDLGLNTLFFYNWHNIIFFSLIVCIYYKELKNRHLKLFLLGALVVFLALAFVDYSTLTYWNVDRFNKLSYPVSGFFSIIFLLLYFYQLLKELSVPNLSAYPLFWFSTGALMYFSGTFLMYLLVQNFTKNPELGRLYWPIDAFLSIVFNLLIGLALIKNSSRDNLPQK